MGMDDFLGDCQPQPCSTPATRPGLVDLIETFENPRQILRRDARTIVRHRADERSVRLFGAKHDPTLSRHAPEVLETIVNQVADEFNRRVGITGLILTKVDGDARGGAAISVRSVTGVPIKFLGVGEKTDALEVFHPDRLASRILGMGDVLTAIEKAQEVMDQEQAMEMGQKLIKGEFNLEDFRDQLQQLKKMGSVSQLLDMLPGMSQLTQDIAPEVTDQQMKTIEAIINSMTPQERQSPRIINASRKRRISKGSGTTVMEVNELLTQFRQMQRMMKQIAGGGKRGRGGMRGLMGMLGGMG